MPAAIKSVIVCDDVRREDNGKILIVGAYIGEILLSALPATIGLAFVCTAVTDGPGPMDIEVRVEHSRATQPLTGFASAVIGIPASHAGGEAWVVLPAAPFAFDQETELVIRAREAGTWREIGRKRVALSRGGRTG